MTKANFSQDNINEKIHLGDKMYGVMKVQGNDEGYFISGRRNTEVFGNLLNRHKPQLKEGKKVMDYGCGHGRMTRHMRNFFKPETLIAADVLEEGVAFYAEEFEATSFVISKHNPISNITDSVDVIVAVSVFTHLPRESFVTNMDNLSKVLSEDGLLMFTANGDFWREKRKIALDDSGFFFKNFNVNVPEGQFKDSDLPPEEYGSASVSTDFVVSLFKAVGLKLLEHIPQGHVGVQDIYIASH